MAQLDIALDRSSDMPLGKQLAWQLRALIASGRLAEGERLPGVREMATVAGVNVNTIRTVYGRLADEGVIVSEHGRGTFVRDRGRAQSALERFAASFPGTPAVRADEPRTAETRRRASLRAEIALLERELAALEVPTSGGNGETAERRSKPAPQLLTAAELEAIRDGLVERLRPLRADRTVARDERERERVDDVERELERHRAEPVRRQKAIATSTPRFESGAGGWSLRWRG